MQSSTDTRLFYRLIEQGHRSRKSNSVGITLLALGLVGTIDYLIGYRFSITVLYIFPIGFATLFVGRLFAAIAATLSVIIWIGGDLLAGLPNPGISVLIWNGGIIFSIFIVVIYLVDQQRRSVIELESIVEERTQALRREMQERERLEQEILDLSERERLHFGQELHDIVCQDLAGIAMAGHLLVKKLNVHGANEARQVLDLVRLVESALTKTRSVARGFFTAGFDLMSLTESLRELADNAQTRSKANCTLVFDDKLTLPDESAVIHIFRIAQEALQNAIKHSEATEISISLAKKGEDLELSVSDNGKGFLLNNPAAKKGLGLRIMAYRTSLIGGKFSVESPTTGGTRIVSRLSNKAKA